MKYFNGYEKKTGKRVIVEIYDNPEPNLFDERDVLGRVSYVEKTGFTMIYDMEDLFNLYNIREIPDTVNVGGRLLGMELLMDPILL